MIFNFLQFVIGPVVTIIDLIWHAIKKGRNIIVRQYEEENYYYLYFSLIKGAGEVSCMLCAYSTKLTGYVDGCPGSDWNQKGFKCQSCGKFHEIEFADRLEQLPKCECGGELSRNRWLF